MSIPRKRPRRKKPVEEKQLICTTHDQIFDLADGIIENFIPKIKNGALFTLPKILEDIEEELQEIKRKAVAARLRGQAMEDRMRAYREAIEALGFTREE